MHALVLLNKDKSRLRAFLTSVYPLSKQNQMREGLSISQRYSQRVIGNKRETLALQAGDHRLQLQWQAG
jgi:hypothetical protein